MYIRHTINDDAARNADTTTTDFADTGLRRAIAHVEEGANAARRLLDEVPAVRRDEALRRAHDVGRRAVSNVRRYANAQAVTNAWLKAYEMYDREQLLAGVDPAHDQLFFNAELPGSFLAAANHWLYDAKMSGRARSDAMPMWHASSLHPYVDKSALGDIYGLWSGSARQWLMTPPVLWDHQIPRVTGDLRDRVQCDFIKTRVGGGSVTFYSSDAGIAFDAEGSDGSAQEVASASVHAGQVLCACDLLRPGGRALMKFYTFTQPWTLSLLTFLADRCFDESYVVKPPSSRMTNAEVYFVGLGFRREDALTSDEYAALRERCGARSSRTEFHFDTARPLMQCGRTGTLRNLVAAATDIHGTRQRWALCDLLYERRGPRPPPAVKPRYMPSRCHLPTDRGFTCV